MKRFRLSRFLHTRVIWVLPVVLACACESQPAVQVAGGPTGTFAINPQFDDARNFSGGLAAVRLGDSETGRWGFVAPDGSMRHEAVFVEVDTEPGDDLWAVAVEVEGKLRVNYVRANGEVAIRSQFRWAGRFSEGLAVFEDESGGVTRRGFIDTNGEVVIPATFDDASGFREGLASVAVGPGEHRRYGFVNRRGRIVIPLAYAEVRRFDGGQAAVRLPGDSLWGLIDSKGEEVTASRFEELSEFSEDGLARIRTNGKHGFIGRDGAVKIRPQFDAAGPFSEGFAAVRVGPEHRGRWGYISTAGVMVVNPRFAAAAPFSEGLAAIRVSEDLEAKYGYIDQTGKVVIEPRFTFADRFSEGLAAVNTGDLRDGLWGFIDPQGRVVVEPQFQGMLGARFVDGLAKVRVGTKWGWIYR